MTPRTLDQAGAARFIGQIVIDVLTPADDRDGARGILTKIGLRIRQLDPASLSPLHRKVILKCWDDAIEIALGRYTNAIQEFKSGPNSMSNTLTVSFLKGEKADVFENTTSGDAVIYLNPTAVRGPKRSAG